MSSPILCKNLKIKICNTIILRVVLRGFENRIPRRIFGPKKGANGECIRLHNEELYSHPSWATKFSIVKLPSLPILFHAVIDL